jgi:TolB protein
VGIPLFYRTLTILVGCLIILSALFMLVGQVAFARQDVIAFTSNRSGSLDLYLIDTRLKIIHDLTFQSTENFSPAWSPDGRQLAFASRRNGLPGLFVTDLGREVRAVTNGGGISSFPEWSNEGSHLTYVSSGMRSLRMQSVDVVSSETHVIHTGPPVPQSRASWSPVQDTLAFAGSEGITHGIYLVEADGTNVRQIANQRTQRATPIDSAWRAPAWSPDGTRIAYSNNGINIVDLLSGEVEQLSRGFHGAPSWSPDGQRLAFVTVEGGNWDIYIMNAEGGSVQRLTYHARADFDPVWKPYD